MNSEKTCDKCKRMDGTPPIKNAHTHTPNQAQENISIRFYKINYYISQENKIFFLLRLLRIVSRPSWKSAQASSLQSKDIVKMYIFEREVNTSGKNNLFN